MAVHNNPVPNDDEHTEFASYSHISAGDLEQCLSVLLSALIIRKIPTSHNYVSCLQMG